MTQRAEKRGLGQDIGEGAGDHHPVLLGSNSQFARKALAPVFAAVLCYCCGSANSVRDKTTPVRARLG